MRTEKEQILHRLEKILIKLSDQTKPYQQIIFNSSYFDEKLFSPSTTKIISYQFYLDEINQHYSNLKTMIEKNDNLHQAQINYLIKKIFNQIQALSRELATR